MKLFLLLLVIFIIIFLIWHQISGTSSQLGGGTLKKSMNTIDGLLQEFSL